MTKLEKIVREQEEIGEKTGIKGISESWTWNLFIKGDIVEIQKHIMSPKSCLKNSRSEWENVKSQGCTKLEVIRNCSEETVQTYKL